MALVMMPRLGVSVTEGTVSVWLKQIGDAVEAGEPIVEVATDKVDTEVESTHAGVLSEQRYAEGEVVPVGEPLAVVTVDGEAPQQTPVSQPELETAPDAEPEPGATAAPVVEERTPGRPADLAPGPVDHAAAAQRLVASIGRSGRPPASPAARRLAADVGLSLSGVTGTGAGGHVTRPDVARLAAEPGQDGPPVGYEDVPFVAVPTSRIRRVTAEHMTRSRRTAAHMTTEVDVDLGVLSDLRARLNAQRQSAGRPKLSFLPFVARAACSALLEHPDLNATFEPERLLQWAEVNLGIAVDTPRGLMVPVLRGAQRLTLESLAEGIVDLAEGARDQRLGPDDYRAGTFTISNPGSVGAVSAPAIINQPQVAILGMPAIMRRPWVVTLPDGQESIAIRPILRLALTFDHCAVDGADATRCLVAIRERLEAWGVDDYR